MGMLANYSYSTLAEAATGKKFPTWPATQAFLIGCGADEVEIRNWRREWERARAMIPGAPGGAAVTASATPPRRKASRLSLLRPVQDDLVGPVRFRPQPDSVHTFGDLQYELGRMKAMVGNPGLRPLSRRMARSYSTTTLSDIFTGKRPPGLDLTLRLVNAMLDEVDEAQGLDETDTDTWTSISEWREAWNRAEFHQRSTTRPRPARRSGAVVAGGGREESGPTANIIASMDIDVAAVLLSNLAPHVAGTIIAVLPTKKASDILTAIEMLHRATTAQPPPQDDHRSLDPPAGQLRPVTSTGITPDASRPA
ncbi:hypothetical protein ACFXHA_43345 [Nocardia sp. NPDC059240]|uniref:hypothetical protein n=1 Tax=Nocardia sp. NPDC059240 TaxID=3346786 RepID=UPI0036C65122